MEFNFTQNQTVEDVSAVPETFRGAYVKGDDGKFNINPEFAGFTAAIDGLNGALRKERETVGTLKKQPTATSVLEALGFADVETAQTEIGALKTTVAERAKVDPAKIRSEIEATFTAKEQGYKDQLSGMEKTLFKHLVESTARQALAEHKGNELFLMPHIAGAAKVVKDETSGDFVVRVVDSEGQYRGDGKGGFMGVTDLVGELKSNKAFAGAFESSTNTGDARMGQPVPRAAVRQVASNVGQGDKTGIDKISSGLSKLQRA